MSETHRARDAATGRGVVSAPPARPRAGPPPLLELRGVSKTFADFAALDGVDFTVRGGEIVGLLGENGAGKSTLMNLVGGLHEPDGGEIRWDGRAIRLASPRDATARGIGVVHQHFMLVPVFTVAENMALHAPRDSALFDAREWASRVEQWARSLGWRVDARRRVEELSVGERQRVEILKALFSRSASQASSESASEIPSDSAGEAARLLLLDEPTANLTPREADELFGVLRGLRERGCGIVFVSHKLREVLALCDRVVVLHRGRIAGERLTAQTDASELAALMVGRETSSGRMDERVDERDARPDAGIVNPAVAAPAASATEPPAPSASAASAHAASSSSTSSSSASSAVRLVIRGLSCGVLRDFSLEVRGGEIVGLAGVAGNGQRELMEVLGGLRPPQAGSLHVNEDSDEARENEQRENEQAENASDLRGLSIIPADRQHIGLIQSFDLVENMALSRHLRRLCRGRFAFDWRRARHTTRELMERFDVRAPATRERTPAANLSGGNAQKLVVARALQWSRGAIVAAEPTRGLDVGAAQFVRGQLRRAADEGSAVLLVSTDLDEILDLSDRIGVLYEGRLLPDENLLPSGVSRATIGALMGGAVQGEAQK